MYRLKVVKNHEREFFDLDAVDVKQAQINASAKLILDNENGVKYEFATLEFVNEIKKIDLEQVYLSNFKMPEHYKIFSWDWKESAPIDDILEYSRELMNAGHTFYQHYIPTGSDQYELLITTIEEISVEDLLAIYNKNIMLSEDFEDEEDY